MYYYTLLFRYIPFDDAILKNISIVNLFERFGFIVNTVCTSFNTENAKCSEKDFIYFMLLSILYILLMFVICCYAKNHWNKM